MLGAMTSPAVLLAVAAAVVTVRGPSCTDGMLTHTLPASMTMAASTAMVMVEPVVTSPPPGTIGRGADDAARSTPSEWCLAAGMATGRSSTAPVSCLQATPTAKANLTGAVTPATALEGWRVQEAAPAARPVIAVLRHAATLHQLGLLRT